mmetsp:Transcript_7072/g.23435  ORF Transcript_7072/g.23435 Transcript_7072/m.23435 type:complete len:323 (-) Transcript_7072:64-1032(-)
MGCVRISKQIPSTDGMRGRTARRTRGLRPVLLALAFVALALAAWRAMQWRGQAAATDGAAGLASRGASLKADAPPVPRYMELMRGEAQLYEYRFGVNSDRLGPLRPEFEGIQFSRHALQKVLAEYDFETVLDVGSGAGEHSRAFASAGKRVVGVEFGRSVYWRTKRVPGSNWTTIVGDFNALEAGAIGGPFDLVWASQVLEHQLNPQAFVRKLVSLTADGGLLMISVPSYKGAMVGGHVTAWNAGLVLYHLVHAGVDCSEARVGIEMHFIIDVIVRKRAIPVDAIEWEFDSGDIDRASRFLPVVNGKPLREQFHGEIAYLNW